MATIPVRADHRRLRLGGRLGDPGRPEDLPRLRRVRHERGDGDHGAEHARRHRRAPRPRRRGAGAGPGGGRRPPPRGVQDGDAGHLRAGERRRRLHPRAPPPRLRPRPRDGRQQRRPPAWTRPRADDRGRAAPAWRRWSPPTWTRPRSWSARRWTTRRGMRAAAEALGGCGPAALLKGGHLRADELVGRAVRRPRVAVVAAAAARHAAHARHRLHPLRRRRRRPRARPPPGNAVEDALD